MSEKSHKNLENYHKKVKIVPKNEENLSAWKYDKPEYLENLLKTETQKPIKIYSIDIEADEEDPETKDVEANGKANPRKSFFTEKCRLSVISENAWWNFYNKSTSSSSFGSTPSAPGNLRKHKNFKNIIKKIIDHCPFKLPWVVLIISVIQVIILFNFFNFWVILS